MFVNNLQNLCDLVGLELNDLEANSIQDLQPVINPKSGEFEIKDNQFRDIQKIIAEISRYAMMDLSILRNHLGKSEGIGSATFHTRTFNDWVFNKSKAVLMPCGIHPDWIKRVSMSILKQSANKENADQKRWEKEDRFHPSILYLGEILRLGGGMNSITPSRYVDTGRKKLLVSSMPTAWLRKEIGGNGKVTLSGIMRFLELNKEHKFSQSIDDYLNVPVEMKKIIDDHYSLDSRHNLKEIRGALEKLIRNRSTGIGHIQFRQEVEIDETDLEIMKWENYSSQQSWQAWPLLLDENRMIPYRPLKLGRYGNTRYYIALPTDESLIVNPQSGSPYRSDTFEYYRIPAEWQKYAIRIFSKLADLVKIDSNRIRLRKTPPMCGYRMLNAFGAQYNQKTNNYPAHYFVKDPQLANNLIGFLQKYCFYSEVEE